MNNKKKSCTHLQCWCKDDTFPTIDSYWVDTDDNVKIDEHSLYQIITYEDDTHDVV